MKKIALCTVCLGLAGAALRAQEAAEAKPVDEAKAGFQTSLNVGAIMTDGNSETLQAHAALVTEGEREGLGSLRAGIEGRYGESTVDGDTETTVETAGAFGGLKKTLSPKTYLSLGATALYDDIAEIDYRIVLSSGLGLYLVKEEDLSLSVDFGPACLWEEVSDVSDDAFLLRFSQRFEYAISKTAKIWQSAEYLPVADDFDDYLLNLEVGIEAILTSRANLRFVLQDKYDSIPGEGLEKNDLALVAGIGFLL